MMGAAMINQDGSWDGYIGTDYYGAPVHVGDVVRDTRTYGRDTAPVKVGRATVDGVLWHNETETVPWYTVGTSNVVKIS